MIPAPYGRPVHPGDVGAGGAPTREMLAGGAALAALLLLERLPRWLALGAVAGWYFMGRRSAPAMAPPQQLELDTRKIGSVATEIAPGVTQYSTPAGEVLSTRTSGEVFEAQREAAAALMDRSSPEYLASYRDIWLNGRKLNYQETADYLRGVMPAWMPPPMTEAELAAELAANPPPPPPPLPRGVVPPPRF